MSRKCLRKKVDQALSDCSSQNGSCQWNKVQKLLSVYLSLLPCSWVFCVSMNASIFPSEKEEIAFEVVELHDAAIFSAKCKRALAVSRSFLSLLIIYSKHIEFHWLNSNFWSIWLANTCYEIPLCIHRKTMKYRSVFIENA